MVALGTPMGHPYEVSYDHKSYLIDGKRTLLVGGSIQWARLPPEVWQDRIEKFKQAGFNTVGMYVPWNLLEPKQGEYQFEQSQIRRFLTLCQEHGLFVIIRPGPYITNEINGGGLPTWLTKNQDKSNFERNQKAHLRTHDPDFIEPTARYFKALTSHIRDFFADRGGPIILFVIENEYTWFERFHAIDKLFWDEGEPERPPLQKVPTTEYFEALKKAALDAGVPVPLTTCPGDAQVSAMGDVPDIIPNPSIYEWATPLQPEQAAYQLRTSMHSDQFQGIYQNMPAGALEINRSPMEFRRLFMGGLDLLMAFNVTGIHQEGYNNAVALAARVLDQAPHWIPNRKPDYSWIKTIFAFGRDELRTGFVSPQLGYFHNVIDYQGAISPAGVLTDVYYLFRKDNHFYQSFNETLALLGTPYISESRPEDRFKIHQPDIGVPIDDKRVHYWYEAENGMKILSLVNQTGRPLTIHKGAIEFDGERFPKRQEFTIGESEEPISTYAFRFLLDTPLGEDLSLHYSTSEVGMLREFADGKILVLFGPKGTDGEFILKGDYKIKKGQHAFSRHSKDNSHTYSYTHQSPQWLTLASKTGNLYILVVTTEDMTKSFLDDDKNPTALYLGINYLDPKTKEIHLEEDHYHIYQKDSLLTYPNQLFGQREFSLLDLDEGHMIYDGKETEFDYQDDEWSAFKGEPKSLDHLGIYKGAAFYRVAFDLNDHRSPFNRYRLYVEHASDIIGIYLNGHYLGTVNPMGTEINSRSSDRRYRLPKLTPYLKPGKNILTFRTEIWGHGSFMFSRGRFRLSKAQLPAVGIEGLKGLYGRAHLGGVPLEKWRYRAQFSGQRQHYATSKLGPNWQKANLPLNLLPGGILWYRTRFKKDEVARMNQVLPLALELSGRNLLGTVYLNGRIIGRWISDQNWLQKGNWVQGIRQMWVDLDPDHYPLPDELLKEENELAILLQDTSAMGETAQLESVRIIPARENLHYDGEKYIRTIRRVFKTSHLKESP